MPVGDVLLLMLNTSRLFVFLYRSVIGKILLRRMSDWTCGGCHTLSTGKNGTRPLKPMPFSEKLLNIPVTGVSLTLTVGLPYGRSPLNVVTEESSQLFTAYL